MKNYANRKNDAPSFDDVKAIHGKQLQVIIVKKSIINEFFIILCLHLLRILPIFAHQLQILHNSHC